MDKESMLQAAEEEWLGFIDYDAKLVAKYRDAVENINVDECNWHWFWLILAESIWPSQDEDATDDFRKWLITGE